MGVGGVGWERLARARVSNNNVVVTTATYYIIYVNDEYGGLTLG